MNETIKIELTGYMFFPYNNDIFESSMCIVCTTRFERFKYFVIIWPHSECRYRIKTNSEHRQSTLNPHLITYVSPGFFSDILSGTVHDMIITAQ